MKLGEDPETRIILALITAKWTLVIYKEDQERTEGEKVDNFGFSLSLFAGDMELLWGGGGL